MDFYQSNLALYQFPSLKGKTHFVKSKKKKYATGNVKWLKLREGKFKCVLATKW